MLLTSSYVLKQVQRNTAKIKFSFYILFSALFFSSSVLANDNYEKALSSFHKKEYNESIIHLKNSLQEDQTHITSRVLMAENYLALGQGSSAETQLVTAQKGGADNARLSPLFAQAYLLQHKYERVLEILNPRNNSTQLKSNILVYRGLAYLGQDNLTLAQEEFSEALALVPNNTEAILGQAKLALKQKKHKDVAPQIEKVLSIDPNHRDGLLMAAITYKNNQEIDKAIKAINHLISISPNNYNALLVRSVLLVDLNKYDEALADLNKITKKLPNEPLSNYIKAATLSTINSEQEANKIYAHLAAITDQLPKKIMDEQPIYYFVAGLASFQEGNYALAEKSFLAYNKFQPQDIKAIKLLANTQLAIGANSQAKKHLMNAHFINKQDYEINTLLGRVNMLTNDLIKAEYFFGLMQAEQPNTLATKKELANFYLFTGRYEDTIKLFSTAITDDDYALSLPTNILFMLVRSYKETKQYNNALAMTQKIIQLEPKSSYAYQEQGSLFGLIGEYAKAKENYLISQKLDKTNFQVVIYLARFVLAEGKPEEAISLLRKQLTDGDNSAIFVELGNAYETINDSENADLFYRKAYSFNPSSVLSLTKIVNGHISKNELFKALSLVEDHIRKYDEEPQVYELAAKIYYRNNQHTKALYALEKAVKTSTEKGDNLLTLAKMQLQLNQREFAVNSLQRAISWENDFVPAYLLLIAIFTEDKKESDALDLIQRLEDTNKDTSLTNRLKGELFWALNNTNKASRYFKSSIKIKPNQEATLGLYRIYRRSQNFKKIDSLLSKWLENNPDDIISAISLAENYRQQGKLKQSFEYYQQLLSSYPNSLALLNNTAIIALELEQYEQATQFINKAYSINNKHVNILDTKAWIEVHKGNFDIALPLLREANTIDYQNAEVQYHLAVTLQKMGRDNEALTYLESAVNSEQNFYEKAKAVQLLKEWQKQ